MKISSLVCLSGGGAIVESFYVRGGSTPAF